jgi:hypothetical protein
MFWEVLLKAQRPGAITQPGRHLPQRTGEPGEQGPGAFMTDYDNYIPPGEFSCPAASRRLGSPKRRTPASSSDHNGYALAYVYFEGEQGPSRSVGDEPGCRNEKLKK